VDSPKRAHGRPSEAPLAVIEQVFTAETEAVRSVDQSGIAFAGICRFLNLPVER
jgi:hypothetical protein